MIEATVLQKELQCEEWEQEQACASPAALAGDARRPPPAGQENEPGRWGRGVSETRADTAPEELGLKSKVGGGGRGARGAGDTPTEAPGRQR